jgi:hypothetical protein
LRSLNCSEYDANSVHNKFGNFGSAYSETSIRNHYSEYGSKYSDNSGAKATAAVMTLGWSMLATGLSRKLRLSAGDGGVRRFNVVGGFLQVADDVIRVVTESATPAAP